MSPQDKRISNALRGAPKIVVATAALMEELTHVLIAEIEVVTKRKVSEHPELLKHKQRLAIDYSANMKSLAVQQDMLKKLPDAAKSALREVARKLKEAAFENARMLQAAANATKQLIQNVIAMVKVEALPSQAYKNHRKAHLQLGTYSPKCKAVALSRVV